MEQNEQQKLVLSLYKQSAGGVGDRILEWHTLASYLYKSTRRREGKICLFPAILVHSSGHRMAVTLRDAPNLYRCIVLITT